MQPDVQVLTQLKDQALNMLSGMADHLVDDEMSTEVLLMIARATGRQAILSKILDRCSKMEDSSEKADILLEVVGEIENQLAVSQADDVNNESEPSSSASSLTPIEPSGEEYHEQ